MGIEHEEINVVVLLPARVANVFAMLTDEELVQLEVLADNGFADSGHVLVGCCWLLVDDLDKHGGGNLVAEFNRANPACQNKLDLPGADLLIEHHGREDLPFG